MNKQGETNFAPILPFDETQCDHFTIYNNVTYEKDARYCNRETIRMESGNVYRYFRCTVTEPYIVGGT